VDALPDRAVESFAGVSNPFSLRRLAPGEKVVDVGSGAGFDSFIAAGQVGLAGQVVGIDMTAEMLAKSRQTGEALGLAHVEFRHGLAEALPVEDGWADVVISNGVINLCADKKAVFAGRSSAIAVSSRLCPGLLSAMPLRLPANPQPRKVTASCCSSPNTSQVNTSPCQWRRGPRGVQAGIPGSHAQELAACLTLPSEGDGAIAGHGDYPEPRQPGTRQERMGWYGRSGTGR
jgi:SAM-dependent methyltransferase